MKISLVIPAFNEAEGIEAVLEELHVYMKAYEDDSEWEIIVVNDGSSDNTKEILKRIEQSNSWLKAIDMAAHYGRGMALRKGFEAAKGDILVSLDADLSYAPYHIKRLIEKMEEDDADIVLASAYGKNGTVKNVPYNRLWISKIGNRILSYMFGEGITVLTCVVRAYKREFLERLDLHSNDKELHLEILYKARMLGAKMVEVPADLYWREEKLIKSQLKIQPKRRSTIKTKKTSISHLFFALLSKPGLIFWVPGYFLILLSLVVGAVILDIIILNMLQGDSLYLAIRNSMISGALSWLTSVISFLLGIQFFSLGFLTNQNKNYHEEMYKTLNAIFTEIKKKKD